MRTLPLASLLLLVACGGSSTSSSEAGATPTPQAPTATPTLAGSPPPAATTSPTPAYVPKRAPDFDFTPGGPIPDAELGDYYVEMRVSVDGEDAGVMDFDLWPQFAPKTVRNFLRYCAEGFYDGLSFHRIVRDFMVQGGDPTGTGAGDGPYGNIPGEFTLAPGRTHGYGVLSMARSGSPDSASCQFFIVCAETASVWNLDGKYASFGKLVKGVDALEKLANAPTVKDGRENSKPQVEVLITSAVVKKKPLPESREKIERPAPDLGGEPERILVQHVLISFQGANPRIPATRSKEEAAQLAKEIQRRARDGEDFTSLVRKYSADPAGPDDPSPGTYLLLNDGVSDTASERAMFQAEQRYNQRTQELRARMGKGELKFEEVQAQLDALKKELLAGLPKPMPTPRGRMVPGFSDTAFSLKPGEIGIAAYNPQTCPFGYHVIKRLR